MVKPKILFTDGEGPLVFKDLARDIAIAKIPEGETIFDTLSLYVGHASETRGLYQPGETLAFLVPHLLAHGVTDEDLETESENVQMANGVEDYLARLFSEGWQVRVISTAYEHLWNLGGPRLGIPKDHIASTRLSLDKIRKEDWSLRLQDQVLQLEGQIIAAKNEFSQDFLEMKNGMPLEQAFTGQVVRDCENAITHTHRTILPKLNFNILERVTVVGGDRKTGALAHFARELDLEPADLVYVGDSITDDKTHRFVKENGGLSIAVNGDKYAIRNAVIAIATEDMQQIKPLLDSWVWGGHGLVRSHIEEDSRISFGKERPMSRETDGAYISLVTGNNVDGLSAIHKQYRVRIRGKSAPIL